METLYIDCTGGARKESLVVQLLEMLDEDRRDEFCNRFRGLGLGVDICARPIEPHGGHEHHSVDEVRDRIRSLDVSDAVRQNAVGIYDILAAAEANAHGVPLEEVHFHEVGNSFAIAYIVAFCMLVEELDSDEIVASPITTGFGCVDCAHGRLSIPAPATANVLDGLPTVKGDIEGELTTPTGAAMVKYFANRYS